MEFIVGNTVVPISESELYFFVTTHLTTRLSVPQIVGKEMALDFLSKRLYSKRDLELIRHAILVVAENTAFSTYVLMKATDENGARTFMKDIEPMLRTIRRLATTKVKRTRELYEIIDKMIDVLLEYGIDPF